MDPEAIAQAKRSKRRHMNKLTKKTHLNTPRDLSRPIPSITTMNQHRLPFDKPARHLWSIKLNTEKSNWRIFRLALIKFHMYLRGTVDDGSKMMHVITIVHVLEWPCLSRQHTLAESMQGGHTFTHRVDIFNVKKFKPNSNHFCDKTIKRSKNSSN